MEASRVGSGANNKKRHTWNECHWMHEEDKLLVELVKRHGPGNWSCIADHIRGRTGMSCRLRWVNHLNPKVDKTQFSKEERERLLQLHREFGNKWSAIVSFFPRRTDNQLKNQYHALVGSRNMRVAHPSSSTNHRGSLNKGSIVTSYDASLSELAVGPQFSEVPQPENNCGVCVLCLGSMPGKTNVPLFCGGSSSIYGRDETWFVDHFPSLSSNGAHSFESINHGTVYVNLGPSHGDSNIFDARSAEFWACCPVAQHQREASVEMYQFIDFLGFGSLE